MVYLNAGESSNRFAAPRRGSEPASLARAMSRLAHFALAFGFMMVIAAALLAHGLVAVLSSLVTARAKSRRASSRQDRARYVPAYPSAMSKA